MHVTDGPRTKTPGTDDCSAWRQTDIQTRRVSIAETRERMAAGRSAERENTRLHLQQHNQTPTSALDAAKCISPVSVSSVAAEHELLEELLTYDDLFLETFNAFLAMPAFPLRLHYDRLTGRLQELDGFLLPNGPNSLCYGATDTERERVLSWLAQERFPPFQRTLFYLEYKLAKLLLCPLDDKYPGSRYAIRGFSRQSDSTGISSIPSHSSTERQPTGVPSHVLLRLPSQTRSTPACLGHSVRSSGQISTEISLEFPGILSLAQSPAAEHLSRFQLQRLRSDSSIQTAAGRLRSDWISAGEPVDTSVHLSRAALASLPDHEFIELHMDGCQKPCSGPRKVLQFDLNETRTGNSQEEEMDAFLLPCFGTAALQQLKEEILGTRVGMDSFREFLHGTLGIHLLDFWIDCEDIMEHTTGLEKARTAPQEIQLFFFSALRSIQAKYKLMIPPACWQRGGTSSPEETAFAALSRSQYDALRRLRSYWVPRFLIHHQRTRQLSSGFPVNKELFPSTDFLLPVADDQRDTMRNEDLRMQFRRNRKSGVGPTKQVALPADPSETLMTTRFLQVLMCDLGDGDGFLHYLTRFEDPQKTHNLLLWRKLKLYEAAWAQEASQSEIHRTAWQIFQTFIASYAGCNTGLSSLILDYIQHLERMLSFGSEDLKPSTFEPVIPYVLVVLDEMWLHYLRHEVTTFLEYCVPESHEDGQSIMIEGDRAKQKGNERIKKRRQNGWPHHDQKGRGRHRKKSRRKAAAMMSHSTGSAAEQETTGERSPSPEDSPTPQNAPDLLSNAVVLNVYRKVAHKIQDVALQRILGLLQDVEACQDAAQSKNRLGCVRRFLEIWDKPLGVEPSACFPEELKTRLEEELDRGEISDTSWKEIRHSLHSFLAPGFEQFWDEVSEGLSKRGVQPSEIPEEHWAKLEPFLHSIATKVALGRLKSRKAHVGSAAAAQPVKGDKASFWQSLRKAAEGWPTIEMLHFLKHLQGHGPPVLESGLHFLLEVQKFKNAHHDWPDMAHLKKKVHVIRDCFLNSQIEPRLQVAVDTRRLGRAIRAAEQATQEEISVPPPSLFDELKHSVFNILLPYWAAFQKQWLKQSPASAQKAPVLRNQLLLQKRQAMLEKVQGPPTQLLQLPPLQQPREVQRSRAQEGFTYTFSISKGLTLQAMSKELMSHSKTSSSRFPNRKRSTGFQFPSLPNVPLLT